MVIAILLLAVAIVGVAVAAVFGWRPYREARLRPALALSVNGPATLGITTSLVDVRFELALTNVGPGVARDWRVSIESTGHQLHLRDPHSRAPGVSERQVEGRWRVNWSAMGAADVIGPGLDRLLDLATDQFGWDGAIDASFAVSMPGLARTTGRIRVRVDGAKREALIHIVDD